MSFGHGMSENMKKKKSFRLFPLIMQLFVRHVSFKIKRRLHLNLKIS